MIKITLSRKLGELRINQVELSRMTGIRNATINEMYNGIAERVSLEHIDLICDALQCEPWEILEWKPNKESKIKYDRTGKLKSDAD